MPIFWNTKIVDYFDMHNIQLQKNDIYADFLEYPPICGG